MIRTTQSTPIEALSANVLDTRFENFDQTTLDNAKNRIIDVVGCLIGGANASGNPALIDLVKEWGGREEATILVHGGKVPAQNAAMVNSIMSRTFDFEALCPLVEGEVIPAHTSGTTIPTAITMAESKGINGRELISALLVGDDVASRVLAASGFVPSLGWDCIGTTNMIGATAIAGRLLALNEREMRNAFGIVLNQLAGSSQSIWDGTTAFKLAQGISARNGIFSAHLAKAGWTGPDDALFSRFGYYNLYTQGCVKPEILTRDLGKKYYADAVFKPYPCCRGTHPVIDCALAIVQEHDIKAEDIVEATIYIPRGGVGGFLEQPFSIGDFPHACGIFSYQYTAANALLRKSVKPEHFSEESIRDPQISALIKKIKIAELPGAPSQSARLKIKMKDGREFSESNNSPKGDPVTNPMTKDEIIAKYMANVDFSRTVTRDNARKLLELLENLEELDSVNKIVALLVP
jgi:2-methylcitrate dehydratase PrpD